MARVPRRDVVLQLDDGGVAAARHPFPMGTDPDRERGLPVVASGAY